MLSWKLATFSFFCSIALVIDLTGTPLGISLGMLIWLILGKKYFGYFILFNLADSPNFILRIPYLYQQLTMILSIHGLQSMDSQVINLVHITNQTKVNKIYQDSESNVYNIQNDFFVIVYSVASVSLILFLMYRKALRIVRRLPRRYVHH